jgi:MFS family permease
VRLLSARIVDTLAPPRLGSGFRWLWASALVTNAGDGVVLTAGPLLVASLDRDPFLVSLALMFEYLPTLLFGIIGGVIADRVDRRRMVIVANLARSAVLLVLVTTIVVGAVNIAIVLGALFLLGSAEVFADSASSTLLPGLVAKEDLGVANARMNAAFLFANQLLLPPVGAFLFAVGPSVPFATDAIAFVLGVVLISRIAHTTLPAIPSRDGASIRSDLAEGVRWLIAHPPMRTLTLTILVFNVTYGAAWSVLVLYAGDRLGMDEIGFGLLTSAIATGGVIGTASYGALERRFALADIMRVGLCIETGTHLVLALTTSPQVALATLVVFGAHAFVWGTTSTVVRQRAVPNELLGRIGGVYRMAIIGGIVAGTPIGGVLARTFGITAPFWFAFAGSALLVVVMWREFGHIAHDPEAPLTGAA